MRTKSIAKFMVLCLVLLGVAKAQTATTNYDKTKPLTLKGIVAGKIAILGNKSFLILDVVSDTTKGTERWAVEGNDREKLAAAGWVFPQPPATFPPPQAGSRTAASYTGQEVTVVAYPPKTGKTIGDLVGSNTVVNEVPVNATEGPIARLAAGGPRVDLADQLKAGRLVHGTDVTFNDGKTLVFGEK